MHLDILEAVKERDDLSWYARKADGLRSPARAEVSAQQDQDARVPELLEELRVRGIRGSLADRTLYARHLPPGCRGCLAGKGTNLYVTGLCTRECFFCFNHRPRTDETVVHGLPVRTSQEAVEIVARYHLRSIGISGGEPLLKLDRTLELVRSLRALPQRLRLDLYTNGDLLTRESALQLKEAGVDSLRFNLAANGFELGPVRIALEHFPDTTVEIPAVPALARELERMVLDLDALGVPFLNIHELFECRENSSQIHGQGHSSADRGSSHLLWRPVLGGEAAALELLLFSLKNAKRLSAYYCSCRTQELISQRGLKRRKRLSSPLQARIPVEERFRGGRGG